MAELIAFKGGVQCHVVACNGRLWEAIGKTALVAPPLIDGTMVVTSISDSDHGPGSLHFAGRAFDVRYQGIRTGSIAGELESQYGEAETWCRRIRQSLGVDWDVVVESDHIHVEYDPESYRPERSEGAQNG